MKRYMVIVSLFLAFMNFADGSTQCNAATTASGRIPNRVLLIVAHPDDESEMAGTVYRITEELSGIVDQVIISDGEGGYRYSLLAGRYYGADLSNEPVGRDLLPHIRRDEARHAARDLGIRKQWFLNERDDHFTLDVKEVFEKSWRAERVRDWLVRRLREGNYDLVLVLLPTEDTHGQHKAASILALQAVQQLPEDRRPAVLGVQASPQEASVYKPLPGYPITTATSLKPAFSFDRDKHFGFHDALSYQIVVDWVIAEHKSQGLFQTTYGQNRFENFWVFGNENGTPNRKVTPFLDKVWTSTQSVNSPK
jgi:N-acetylglucosamine malate deacetylase 2